MLEWFGINLMKTNPFKFQFIVFEKNLHHNSEDNVVIKTVNSVKLLGVTIDNELKFKEHYLNNVSKGWKTDGGFSKVIKYSIKKLRYYECRVLFCHIFFIVVLYIIIVHVVILLSYLIPAK